MSTLINPSNGKPLSLQQGNYRDEDGNSFEVKDGVLRMVPMDNYTQNFGFQWNKFQKTQIDRETVGNSLSKDRFFASTDWDRENLAGKTMLEAGSGAGRFTQVVLDHTDVKLCSFDYSDAVAANFRNNGHHGDRLTLVQASIYEIPFPDNSFDKVFCFGVLQHTPDFRKSVHCLIAKAKQGGEVVVDFYPIRGWWTKVHAKYIFRPVTKRWSNEKLLRKIDRNVNWMMKLSAFFDKIGVGRLLNRFIPVVDIRGTLPKNLTPEQLREWVVLDTFDMFSPEHDHPQKISTVKKWFEEAGVEVTFAGFKTYGQENFPVAIVKGIKK